MDNLIKVAVLGGAIFLAGRKVLMSQFSRGIRNRNPGNIRETTGDLWKGQTGTDGAFAIFASPEYGIRALARILLNYERLHGLDTIEGIISRWAPSNENDTGSYISSVEHALGVTRNRKITVADYLAQLIKAIIKHENGVQPYSDEIILTGIKMEAGFNEG